MQIAPVLFLVFNRPDTTTMVMEAIRGARPPRLYVAADGPRDRRGEAERCEEARRIATAVDWDCNVRTLFRDSNLGCREAVSGAITWFFQHEVEGIILEDDCLPSSDFFRFCTELLDRYREDARIMAICGSSYAAPGKTYAPSYYFSYYADIWGWASWRRAWQCYERDMSRWPHARERRDLESIWGGRVWHEAYWTNLFDATWAGHIDTWDYQWIFAVMQQRGLACYPVRNLISNLGYRSDATHTVAERHEKGANPIANLPHESLGFPLVHPACVERSPDLDRAIEATRLRLCPPAHALMRRIKSIEDVVKQWLGDAMIAISPAGGLRGVSKPSSQLVELLRRKFRRQPDWFLRYCRGVVHVGANDGQEREIYDHHGLTVIWVEALASAYGKLLENIRPYPKQTAIRALVTDKSGQVKRFNIANNQGASSSILDLALHKDIWPEVDYVGSVEIETNTLDELLISNNIDQSVIDGLILDTQGSELLVLKGSQRLLSRISYVKVEAADFEAYKGGATVDSVEEYLKNFSLVLIEKNEFARHSGGGRYYELLFKRSRERAPTAQCFVNLKNAIRAILGDTIVGAIDYYRKPQQKTAWGGPFNGQPARQALFSAIITNIQPQALVETGTYLGTTTEFMAMTGRPVFTIEADSRRFGYARAHLRRHRNVTLLYGDSRVGLRQLFASSLRQMIRDVLFFYLDAHWNDDLPLTQELDIIFSHCPAAVVMIDDFQVPFDGGYEYDDYGPGKALVLDYIAPAVSAHQLHAFYPSTPSVDESGARRGCVVLAKHPDLIATLSSCRSSAATTVLVPNHTSFYDEA